MSEDARPAAGMTVEEMREQGNTVGRIALMEESKKVANSLQLAAVQWHMTAALCERLDALVAVQERIAGTLEQIVPRWVAPLDGSGPYPVWPGGPFPLSQTWINTGPMPDNNPKDAEAKP